MTGPRLEIRLDRIRHNAATLVERLGNRGIAVTGVTKATLGSAEIARVLLEAGVVTLGDSRIENVESLRRAGIDAPMVLIRSPMLSQVDRVVASADASLNTELVTIEALSNAAVRHGRIHGVVLMVELGDLREGILPSDLNDIARATSALPGIEFRGIGTNLACQSGVTPDATNLGELSRLVESLESTLGTTLPVVSGGNSASLDWALGDQARADGGIGRVNDLRLGESILLGREPSYRSPIDGLYTDAFSLVGEVIESKIKPTRPWGQIDEAAFGPVARPAARGDTSRVIVALGRQDVDPNGLQPPDPWHVLGASSDHLVLDCGTDRPLVGDEIRFGLDYSALLRATTSLFVDQIITDTRPSLRHRALSTPTRVA